MKAEGLFSKLTMQAVAATEGWTVAELLSLYSGRIVVWHALLWVRAVVMDALSGLNRCSRKFQSNCEWEAAIQVRTELMHWSTAY